ncbi:FG-GAP repeat domain-containing protein [Streptomyces sp. NPDC001068]|uniref:FG-GAP repeat domain-containing protein n=1 Tax=Streptomyces sp. NPDC001068 TaxID=3364544 RepID=UPI0036AB076F
MRHASARLRLVAATAVLTAALSPLLPVPSASADTAQETVVPPALRSTYTSGALYGNSTYSGHDGAGRQGVFHSLEGAGLVWTRYSTGVSVPVVHPAGYTSYSTAGGDVLAYRFADGRIDLWNAADGTTRTIRTPEGLSLLTTYADLAVAFRQVPDGNGSATREMHLLLPQDDGSTRDVPVTGVPEGYVLGMAKGGDANGLLFLAGRTGGGSYTSVMVDRHTGQVQGWTPPTAKVYLNAQVTSDHVVLFNTNEPTVQVYSRTDLSGAPAAVALDGGGTLPAAGLAVVGDWLVTQPGKAVLARPLAGGPARTLLPTANYGVSAASDGGALAVGRTGGPADDWGVQRIQPGPDGSPTVTQIKALPKPVYRIQGLSLDQGTLVVGDASVSGVRDAYVRTVAATGTPTFGERTSLDGISTQLGTCPETDLGCSQVFGLPGGRVAWLRRGTGGSDRITVAESGQHWEAEVPAGGRITDASGTYLIHTVSGRQSVYRMAGGTPVRTIASGPAALSGDLLWTAGATPGTLGAYDLTQGRTVETVTTDAGCAPGELQALGRWVYWNCGDRAGVYDRTAKKSVSVPADEAKLGDGYVVTHDKAAGKLVLTAVDQGTPVSRVIGELPDTGVSQRDVRWTVDESGADVAYVDAGEQVHLVPSGVTQQPLRTLGPVVRATTLEARHTDPVVYPVTRVPLSKPAAGWTLTVRDKATGKVVDTVTGGPARGLLNVGWDGVAGTKLLPSGPYDWTLSVAPADGAGAPLSFQGSVRLLNGRVVHRDYAGPSDGMGDLLTLSGSGELRFHRGDGGKLAPLTVAGGWSTAIRPVPVGDLNGDNCNDVLIRLSNGTLRLYKPGCSDPLAPTTRYTTLGTGWDQYDVLTAPGDLTRDGRPDLITRNAKTGAVYVHKGTSTGKFAARVKLYDNWKTYKKVVGAGDLNGDGIGDLVAQDKANNLYRYYGTGKGGFGSRVRIATGWGSSYNAVVGVGDITGDGKSDLVMRDTAGNLYRQTGTGKGTFAARVKIATGWQYYKGLF